MVGFGAWAAGGLWWGDDLDDGDVSRAMSAAVDAGVNWFDTAPLYGHGHADELLAKNAQVKGAIIATKVGIRWDGPGAHARSDLCAAHIEADIDASLRRLGRDTLDLAQIHWPCQADTPLHESLGALRKARESGKIRWIGVSNYDAAGIDALGAIGGVVSLQTPYSMLRREFEHDLRAACDRHSLGVLAYEPLCRGLLTGKFTAAHQFSDSDLRARDDRFKGRGYLRALTIASRLKLLARRHETTAAALALAWAITQPSITAVIAGCKRIEQLTQNADAGRLIEDPAVLADIAPIAAAWRG